MNLVLSCLSLLLLLSSTKSEAQTSIPPSLIFKNGEAQPVPEFNNPSEWIKEEVWVETTFDSDYDGKPDRMHVFITRPYQTDSGNLKLPVIYTSSPYYGLKIWPMLGLTGKNMNWDVRQELGDTPKPHKHSHFNTRTKRPFIANETDNTWVRRGYITVYSSSPGTGLSDGAPTIGGENESLAPKAVIDWLCGRAKAYKTRKGSEEVKAFWSSGKVGMTGTSYDGTLCLAAATTGVQGLEAIIPVAPVSSFYHYYRSNGLVRSPGGYLGEDVDVLYDFINTGDKSKRKLINRLVRDSILVKNEDRITGDYNDFWSSRDYLRRIDTMKAAMLMAYAFNDWNVMTDQSIRFYQAAKEKGLPVQLYMHQGAHGGNPPLSMANRWFTRYLHGIENGVEKDPPVRIVREREWVSTPYLAYPNPDAANVNLYLLPEANNQGTLDFSTEHGISLDTLEDDFRVKGKNMPEKENSAYRLLYTTPILKQDLHLSGTAQVRIRLSSSKPAANLSVWLVSLPWEDEKGSRIYDNLITRAWADPQNHLSINQGEPLVPGKFYDVTFNLMPDDQVIRKGQRIGLMIFSSDNEFTLRPEPGTQLIIDLSGCQLTLPLVGGAEAYRHAISSTKKPVQED
ncbi:MAG: Xaa-Pro dipeptidyl-peptidase [Bacteroidetes bacterium]|nr:Xaa-Pro dipeptidyl-peptidase [Bacteroidota bacterium]